MVDSKPGLKFWALAVFAGLATAGMILSGIPALTVAPVLGIAFFWVVLKLPLRIPALALFAMALVIDNPGDIGPVRGPTFTLGEFMLLQMKKVIPIGALVLTGMDASLIGLVALHFYRRTKGKAVDSVPYVPVPPMLIRAYLLGISAVIFALLWGLVRGGDMQWAQWQLAQMLHMPWIALAFALLLPGPQVGPTLFKIVVVAAIFKALLAYGISKTDPGTEFMTSHQDSILFAAASTWLIAHLLEQPSKKFVIANVLIQPVILLGMVANDRRLVWVELALGLAVVFLLGRWSWLKFRLLRLGISAIPAVLAYVAVGWQTAGTGIFKPVGTLKSMADSKSDGSSLWRDLENYNLNATLATNPLTGTGLGHPFVQLVALPDVTSVYPLEPYIPHNSMLGLWAYTGYIGFTTWWLVLVAMVYVSLRGYRVCRSPPERVMTLMAPAVVMIYMLQAYGDVGLAAWHGVLIVATTVAVAAKIAVLNGAFAEPVPARQQTRLEAEHAVVAARRPPNQQADA